MKSLQKLENASHEEVLSVANKCIKILGVVSVNEYCRITGVPQRTVYRRMENGRIKVFLGYPCLNL